MNRGWMIGVLSFGLVQTAVAGTTTLQWDKLNVAGDFESRPLTQSIYVTPKDFSTVQVQLFHYHRQWKQARAEADHAQAEIAKLREAHRTLRMNHDVRELDYESDWSIQMSQNIAQQAKWRSQRDALKEWEARHPVRLSYETRDGRRVLVAAQFGQHLARR